MATLIAPGVDVEFTTETSYASSTAGTVPLIVIATAANKLSSSGSGLAPYTTTSLANALYLATSQRDCLQQYGLPNFVKSPNGTPLHGNELNEYGLHALYKYLGIWNEAYVLRANIDLAQLVPSVSAPLSTPGNGTYWFDLSATTWGLFQSNGNSIAGAAWVSQTPLVLNNASQVSINKNGLYQPLPTVGANGNFAVVTVAEDNRFWKNTNGSWNEIGSAVVGGAAIPTTSTPVAAGSQFTVNGVEITAVAPAIVPATSPATFGPVTVASIAANINSANIPGIIASVSATNALVIAGAPGSASVATNGATTVSAATSVVLTDGTNTPLASLGITAGTYTGNVVVRNNNAAWPAGSTNGDIWVKGSVPNKGANFVVRRYNSANANPWTLLPTPFFPFNGALLDGNPSKDAAAIAGMGSVTTGTLYVGYDTLLRAQVLRIWNGSIFVDLTSSNLIASVTAPTSVAVDGTLWYNTNFQVDVMVGDGMNWQGYRRANSGTDPNGVIISGSAPTTQTNNSLPLVENDLWLDSSDLENYPALYRYAPSTGTWTPLDLTDSTSPFGIVFADARADSGNAFTGIPNSGAYAFQSTATADLLVSDYVDPDAPDARLYPAGMILFNSRVSTYNVKQWKANWFKSGNYDPNTDYTVSAYQNSSSETYTFNPTTAGRWVTVSGLQANGSPHMGRKAQRALIVASMAEAIATNSDISSVQAFFNLVAAPGYPELLGDLNTLNTSQNNISFVIGDTPARLSPVSNTIQNWATNAANVTSTGDDGLTASSEYSAIYYPWAISTNVDGSSVMVPPSTIALQTYAYNDQVAYPWLAPAGLQRGSANVSSVGYLNAAGNYQPIMFNNGQLGTLYANKINPIEYVKGSGYVFMGQKTLSATSGPTDRVNNARLACYLKYNLDLLLKPFLFNQNNVFTQDAAQLLVSNFLTGLVSLNAISDFAVLCNSTNNTADRQSLNQMWIDIAIQPYDAVEFIYIPARMVAQGSSLALS